MVDILHDNERAKSKRTFGAAAMVEGMRDADFCVTLEKTHDGDFVAEFFVWED